MRKCIAIVAYGNNYVIGKNGDLPEWKLKDDMKNFKKMTEGGVVIMGRKTFESFPEKFRPLPNRHNIIITKNSEYQPYPSNNKTYVVDNLILAIKSAYKLSDLIYIIGGGQIYKNAIEIGAVHEIIATEVDSDFDGDTFFPKLLPSEWHEVERQFFSKNEENSHDFSIVTYTSKNL